MAERDITGSLEPVLVRAARESPAIYSDGPRQSGKTTLLKHLFADDFGYVSLELPDARAAAREGPQTLLDANHPPVIFDEIHFAASLLPFIKERIEC